MKTRTKNKRAIRNYVKWITTAEEKIYGLANKKQAEDNARKLTRFEKRIQRKHAKEKRQARRATR